jgi:hypothetical protein
MFSSGMASTVPSPGSSVSTPVSTSVYSVKINMKDSKCDLTLKKDGETEYRIPSFLASKTAGVANAPSTPTMAELPKLEKIKTN